MRTRSKKSSHSFQIAINYWFWRGYDATQPDAELKQLIGERPTSHSFPVPANPGNCEGGKKRCHCLMVHPVEVMCYYPRAWGASDPSNQFMLRCLS